MSARTVQKPASSEISFLRLFDRCVEDRPASPAVSDQVSSLTYGELSAKANALSERLAVLGLSSGACIAIQAPRRCETIVAMLAVVRVGAAFLNIDPSTPDGRRERLLKVSGAAAYIILDSTGEWRVMPLRKPSGDNRLVPEPPWRFQATIYVIPTSGTTGRPKCVAIGQNALSAYLTSANNIHLIGASDRVLCASTLSFDTSLKCVFLALAFGACLDLLPDDPADFLNPICWIITRCVTVADLPTSQWSACKSEWSKLRVLPNKLRLLVIGGEPLSLSDLRVWRTNGPSDTELWNSYGPTECVVECTFRRLGPEPCASDATVGRPLPGRRVYVLDDHLRPLAAGERGEVYVGGAAVAQGYVADTQATSVHFVADPFAIGERMYRTGDLGEWTTDGDLLLHGRHDNMVKIGGYRVNPEEVSSIVEGIEGVGRACTIVHSAGTGVELHTFAESTLGMELEESALRREIDERLPSFMRPASLTCVAALPITTRGKVDQGQLQAEVLERETLAARAGWTIKASIEDSLGMVVTNEGASLIESGMDSVRALKVIRDLECRGLGRLQLYEILNGPTLAAIASNIQPACISAEETPPDGLLAYPLSVCQEPIWLAYVLDEDGSTYNVPLVWDISGPLDRHALSAAIDDLLRSQPALRMVFDDKDPATTQRDGGFHVDSVLREVTAPRVLWDEITDQTAKAPFALRRGPPCRFRLLNDGETSWRLIFVGHHLVFDGASVGLLVELLSERYRGFGADRPIRSTNYKSFVSRTTGPLRFSDADQYVQNVVAVPEMTKFRGDRVLKNSFLSGYTLSCDLPAGFRLKWIEAARRFNVTPFVLFAAAIVHAAEAAGGRGDTVVGVATDLRQTAAEARTIGHFVNLTPIRIRTSALDPRRILDDTRVAVAEALRFKHIPFEKYAAEARKVGRNADSLIAFAIGLDDGAEDLLQMASLKLSVVASPPSGAKFDCSVFLRLGEDGQHCSSQLILELNEAKFSRSSGEKLMEDIGGSISIMARLG